MTQPRPQPTACLALGDGTILTGHGFGATGTVTAQLVFETAMSGYQEALSDPANGGRILVFTFPHIGNTGTTPEDDEGTPPAGAAGLVVKWDPTTPSNWRMAQTLHDWLAQSGRIGIAGIDTRRLVRQLRDAEPMTAALAHDPAGQFDTAALLAVARAQPTTTTRPQPEQPAGDWTSGAWTWPQGFAPATDTGPLVVVIDQGSNRQLPRDLVAAGARVHILPADCPVAQIRALRPAGVVITDGPGGVPGADDPVVALLRALLAQPELPILATGRGHLQLALALGARVVATDSAGQGTNHPVRNLDAGVVEIARLSHDLAVVRDSWPAGVSETHVSGFDGRNCGLRLGGRPVFGLLHRPAAAGATGTDPFAAFVARLTDPLPA